MTQSQYQVGIVRGLENYQKLLKLIVDEDGRLPTVRYYQRSGIVAFTPQGRIDLSSLVTKLEEKGLVLRPAMNSD